MKYVPLRESSAPLPDCMWQLFPESIRHVVSRCDIGRPQDEYHTVIEFEHDVPGPDGPTYIGLGVQTISDPDIEVHFCRGDVIEVHGIKVAVTALEVAKEPTESGRKITFWSVVIDEVQGGSSG